MFLLAGINMSFMAISFIQFINKITVIIGLIVGVVGISMVFLSKRITRVVRKNDEIYDNDKLYVALMSTGLTLILASLILVVIP